MGYITGTTIKKLREKQNLTQRELADRIGVSDKTISKWETNRGLPDISIIEDLAKALRISLSELLTGDLKINDNISGNMKKLLFFVCPICGNIIYSLGEGSFSCCGVSLPPLEAEKMDYSHKIIIESVEDEICISMDHPMNKKHYISFMAYVTSDKAEIVKLYPEQDVCVRFNKKGSGILYVFCNKHGLYKQIV